MLKIKEVSNEWGDFSLENINLEINNQEFFVLLGPTGSGKTLLLELIAGFHYPRSGEIIYKGKNYTKISPEERDVGFVYQDYSLFPHMNVKENISYGLKERKIDKNEINKKVGEMLDLFGIQHLKERYPRTLSGGEKQRVALARAIVIEPDLLLLDEPFSALDEKTHNEMIESIKKIHQEMNLTTVHVTHDQTEAMMLGDRIGVIMNGKIKQIDKPDKLFDKPKSKSLAEFLGVENIFSGRVVKDSGSINVIKLHDGESNLKIESLSEHKLQDEVRIFLRPENIIISKKKCETSARNCFKGTIKSIVKMGFSIRVKIEMEKNIELTVVITQESLDEMNLKVGDKINAFFKASSVHVVTSTNP